MRVTVDTDRCVGHGRCYVLAADVFESDDYGHSEVIAGTVEEGSDLARQAQIAVENCPERAIKIM